jgi:hypothetical protein
MEQERAAGVIEPKTMKARKLYFKRIRARAKLPLDFKLTEITPEERDAMVHKQRLESRGVLPGHGTRRA